MTVPSSVNKVIGVGNDATTSWPFTFPVFDEGHLQVVYTDAEGAESTLDPSAYTVTLNSDQAANPGGTVTYSPAIATGTLLTTLRVVPYTQETDIKNQGGYFPEVLERAIDLIVMQVQQVKEQLARALKLSPSQAAIGELEATDADRASTYLGFDADGNPTLYTGLADTSVSVAMQPVISAASLAAARTAMDVPALTGNNALVGNQTITGAVTVTGDISGTGNITRTSADAGASAGPTDMLDRASASPAAADELAVRKYTGRNDAAESVDYGSDTGAIVSPADGAEHGIVRRREIVAGAAVTQRIWHSMPRQTASSSPSLIVDGIPSIANEIRVSFDLVNATDTANLVLTPRKSSGTDITTLAVSTFYFSSTTTAAAAVATSNNVAGPVGNNANTGGARGSITFTRIQSSRYKDFDFAITFHNSTTDVVEKRSGGGHTGDAAVLTGVKLAFDSGNIDEGYMDVEWRE